MNTGSPTPIKVSIVEDKEDIRQNLGFLLNQSPGMSCSSQHSSAEAALRDLPAIKPDVVLMDINLPRLSGIDCVRRLKPLMPKTQIIMLTVHEDSESIFHSLIAGATGYITKRAPSDELIEGIRNVVQGGSPMSSMIARKVIQLIADLDQPASDVARLSSSERMVVDLLAKGYLYKEIADQLQLPLVKVQNLIRTIYEKLQVHNRTEAVMKYLQR